MYCSQCGVKASGKFCWSCGESLSAVSGATPDDVYENIELTPVVPLVNWADSLDCRLLLATPEIRKRVKTHAASAKTRLSGEDFLAACDGILSPLMGGVPLGVIAKIAQPISERLGLRTGKSRFERLGERPGVVLVAVLCSLAQNSQRIRNIEQGEDACAIQASIPSDMWALKGDLVINVYKESQTTNIDAALTIPGQAFDLGKANRVLDRLFADVAQLAKAA
jgi:hypothetical protein